MIYIVTETHVEVMLFFTIAYVIHFLIYSVAPMHCHNVKYGYVQIGALKILNVPMLVSEQNPKSLGKIVPELDISGAKGPFAKMQFSMCSL